MLGPNLLLLGVSLGQRELPLLLGEEPLLAGPVGLGVGRQVVPELVACHDLRRAAANVSERSIPVVEESSGKLVIVKAPGPVSVVPDEFLGQLDTLLSSEVGVWEVGAGQPVPAAPLLQEGLGGGGHVAQAPVTGQLLAGAVGLEVAAQDPDELLRADIGDLAD